MGNAKRRVRAFLKRNTRSQASLAREVGISPQFLSQILSGRRQPSLDVAAEIEKVTGIPSRAFVQQEAA